MEINKNEYNCILGPILAVDRAWHDKDGTHDTNRNME
jgi:hypothetical protein